MEDQRILTLKTGEASGDCVVYVMSRDQRVNDNHALLAAQHIALERKLPLKVLFILYPIKTRSFEHYEFMLDGLQDVEESLQSLNISFTIIASTDSENGLLQYTDQNKPHTVVFDFSPLTRPRTIAKNFAKQSTCNVFVVDTHNIIPVWTASSKQEFAAHTIRNKIHKLLGTYLVQPPAITPHPYADMSPHIATDYQELMKFIQSHVGKSGIEPAIISGEQAANDTLQRLIETGLQNYGKNRNNIALDAQSGLSPYLHFGQMSSLRVVLNIMNHIGKEPLLLRLSKLVEASDLPTEEDGMNMLFEELIVRKELADNFCFYSNAYRSFDASPLWAQKTLNEHRQDIRDASYTTTQWEHAKTHDPIWNAAQNQLRKSGKIHGYMRMYWAKKMLEWSASPEDGLRDCIYLNDKYSIDGGDPNGYVGILWSIAGLHDRPWFERPVYGKVRYMNDSGLRRKFDVDAYVKQWS